MWLCLEGPWGNVLKDVLNFQHLLIDRAGLVHLAVNLCLLRGLPEEPP